MNEGKLPVPHAVSCNTGTSRFYLKEAAIGKRGTEIKEEDFEEDQEYKKRLETTGYRKDELVKALIPLVPEIQKRDSIFNLRFPPDFFTKGLGQWIKEDPFRTRLEFTMPANMTDQKTIDDFKTRTSHLFDQNYRVIISPGDPMKNGDRQWNFQLLPKSDICGKDATVRDMMKVLGTNTGIIAGDSENDSHALFANYGNSIKDFIRITVGGSSAGLLNIVDVNNMPGRQESQRSFKRLSINEMEGLRVYRERHTSRVDAKSLSHSMMILERAWNIKRRREFPR